MGEANSRKVIDICREYGVVKQRTGGYTPEHDAFAERWFCTNAEMSTCQMLQFDLPENMWEDSRRMATFIYNRVPPTRQTPGEVWLSPHEKQYPTRETMDFFKATTNHLEYHAGYIRRNQYTTRDTRVRVTRRSVQ